VPRCKRKDQLEVKLRSLPDTLFGIYDRFLDRILPEDFIYVEALLRWILFSREQMTLKELGAAIAFDFSNPTEYTYDPVRWEDASSVILEWLEGLIVLSEPLDIDDGYTSVQLAHASVQEYLLSTPFITKFGVLDLSDGLSHTFIARTCIGYLAYFGHHPMDQEPHLFGKYVALFWCHHLSCCHQESTLSSAAMRLLEDGSPQYRALASLYNQNVLYPRRSVESPLQLCCQEGYVEGVRAILANQPLAGQESEDTSLILAATNGHIDVVRLLLESGVDVNLQSDEDTALRAASVYGNIDMMRLLLQHGADINLQCKNGHALVTASRRGDLEIVRLLLEHGADVNLHNEGNGPALATACQMGHLEIVRLLLEHQADVNLMGHLDDGSVTPLEAASKGDYWDNNGHLGVVRLLLDSGANVGTQGRRAAEVARGRDRHKIIALLSERWAVLYPEVGSEVDAHSSDSEL
jgi:ankyrin repeat protein